MKSLLVCQRNQKMQRENSLSKIMNNQLGVTDENGILGTMTLFDGILGTIATLMVLSERSNYLIAFSEFPLKTTMLVVHTVYNNLNAYC
jgi:hypothetical protein